MASNKKSKAKPAKPESPEIEEAVIIGDSSDPSGVTETVVVDDPPVESEPGPASEPEPARRRAGIFPALAGGVLAAAVGFGVAQYLGNDSWPFRQGPSPVDDLSKLVTGQDTQITELRENQAQITRALSELPSPADVQVIADQQSAFLDELARISDRVAGIDQRLTDIENRPIPDVGATVDAVQAYERELTAMRQMFEAELARIEAVQQEATTTEKTITARANLAIERAALARIQAAVDSGASFAEPLTVLTDAGIDIPAGLSLGAQNGITSLTQLQFDFPDAARAVLNASITVEADAGWMGRAGAFIRTQLGTRSLQPRDGDGPDAVLSRAESALKSGNIDQSLALLAGLPDASVALMVDWINKAQQRQVAVDAIAVLNTILGK